MTPKRPKIKGRGVEIFFNNKPAKQQTGKPVRQQTSKPTNQQISTSKATFYFSPTQLKDLELTRATLKHDYNIKVDKSQIVRLAVEDILKDFKEKQQTSKLVNWLTGNKS